MQFGQPLNAALNPFSLGQADLLGTALMSGSGTASPVLDLVALNNYTALLVHIHNPGGATIADALWAQVQTALASSTFSGAFPSQPTVAAIGLSDLQTIIGCQNNIGDGLIVTVAFSGTPPANTGITVYGLTNYVPSPRRGDGRNYPLGSFVANATAANVSTTLIAAPGSSNRILLRYLQFSNATVAGSQAAVTGTLSGANNDLLRASTNDADNSIYESGLLLDPNTSVGLTSSPAGAFASCSAVYDIVPAT